MDFVPTSAITFIETQHGRERRIQRGIHKKDLQNAKKYGKRQKTRHRPNGDPCSKYVYKDITYIVNDKTGEEVTSYAKPLELNKVPLTAEMCREHNQAVDTIRLDHGKWRSNTVVVVDTSGSMKNADVWGARNRLASVWIALALDFIASRIENGSGGAMDVISVMLMGEEPAILMSEQPTTWILYNKIIDIYRNQSIQPKSHGYYLPSLDKTETLLTRNSNESCALGLCFISDGRPSDEVPPIIGKITTLAKRFGRRMQFDAVGIGHDRGRGFETLKMMVEEAKDYGVIASLKLPSMTTNSLGDVLKSFATSVTTVQREMTNFVTFQQQRVRNVCRESIKKASSSISKVSENDFHIYQKDDVKRRIYRERISNGLKKGIFKEASLQNEHAEFVAMSKGPFGEGAERFVYRFFELGSDRESIVGAPLVAKENRYIVEGGIDDETARFKFVRTFCQTQEIARDIANDFNNKLNSIKCIGHKTPRVRFLECCIYQLNDVNLGKVSVLVEEKLDQTKFKWKKWNSNNGYVEGMKEIPKFNDTELKDALEKLRSAACMDSSILEETNENDETNEMITSLQFSESEVAQAFSHFSFWSTGNKRLICDIQGVFDEDDNVLKLTDPVIHYQNPKNDRTMVHGKTDRGRKGCAMFFKTHKCSKLCRLLTKGFKYAEPKNHKRTLEKTTATTVDEKVKRVHFVDLTSPENRSMPTTAMPKIGLKPTTKKVQFFDLT